MAVERIFAIQHKKKEIMVIDYRGLEGDDEVIAFIDEIKARIIAVGKPSLQLTDVRGVRFSSRAAASILEGAHEIAPFILKDAVIGVTGVNRIAFQLYAFITHGNAKAFDDEASAKEWLVE